MRRSNKLYDLVQQLLYNDPTLRGSDKRLMWQVWSRLGYVLFDGLAYTHFIDKNCPTPESVTRCRRKIQELHPELQAANSTRRARADKAEQKGTHIYREPAKKLADPCMRCGVGRMIVKDLYDYSSGTAVKTGSYTECNHCYKRGPVI